MCIPGADIQRPDTSRFLVGIRRNEQVVIRLLPYRDALYPRRLAPSCGRATGFGGTVSCAQRVCPTVHVACTTQRRCRSSDCVCRAPCNRPHPGRPSNDQPEHASSCRSLPTPHHRRHPSTLWTPDLKGNPIMPTSIFPGFRPLSIPPGRSRPSRFSCPLWVLYGLARPHASILPDLEKMK
ncbi:hypothetical protein L226DRAFT_323319 [Lentinus tigrinus ALCF2SS1-7]|uniref:Uncharacterized protein n=1 Tax=Lentinus tigrinus ALCF2SS1-6 TaxID=1328759 RepID=A0A5C2SI05_9APHY|nr:hypothetical protein L227DRAFT_435871 [Lentinus tigrinus ALCF2SS1-6]RPD77469.1 hypothetical protein L226DRAFT_323319 [Lentinus tigrinus ALCF2SS1-7]